MIAFNACTAHGENFNDDMILPIILESGKTIFQYEGGVFHVINTPDSKIIYSSTLEESRQIFSISKTLDFTDLAVANENLVLSLQSMTKQNYMRPDDNFRYYRQQEIYVSRSTMSFEDCQHHCTRHDANMVSTSMDFYDCINSFNPRHIWVNSDVNATTLRGITSYTVRLGDLEIFPENNLGVSIPRIYHYHEHQRQEIYSFQELYSYYDSSSQSYWQTHHYRLQTVVGRAGEIFIYIPEDSRYLTNSAYHSQCACTRLPSLTSKIFNEIIGNYHQLELQQRKMNIGIESARFIQNGQTGSLLSMLKPYLQESTPIKKRNINNYITSDVISPLLPTNVTSQELVQSLMFLGAKKLGSTVALAMLDRTLQHIKAKFGATVMHKLWDQTNGETNFFDISGLSLHDRNFTLVVKFANLDSYSKNVSSNLFLADQLLKNLTLSNEELFQFLQTKVNRMLLHMAADSLINRIDYDAPILAIVNHGKSYYHCQFFITTFSQDSSVTNYLANALPTAVEGDTLRSLDIPSAFSASNEGHSFRFHESQSQALDACVHSFMAQSYGSLTTHCKSTTFSQKKMQILQSTNGIRLIMARGKDDTIKLVCPQLEPMFYTMTSDVMVFISPFNCENNLISNTGILTIRRNDTGMSADTRPKLLFHYNITVNTSNDFYQWLTITILACAVVFFVILLSIFGYLIFKNRIKSDIVSITSSVHTVADIAPMITTKFAETKC